MDANVRKLRGHRVELLPELSLHFSSGSWASGARPRYSPVRRREFPNPLSPNASKRSDARNRTPPELDLSLRFGFAGARICVLARGDLWSLLVTGSEPLAQGRGTIGGNRVRRKRLFYFLVGASR